MEWRFRTSPRNCSSGIHFSVSHCSRSSLNADLDQISMKSICMLLQNFYDMDIRVRRKAEALVAAGYSVDILALRPLNSDAETYVLNGVNIHTYALGKKRGSKLRYLFEYLSFLAWTFFKLSRLMSRRSYAIVDVNNLPDFLVFAALWAKLRGAKVVFDMHEITPEFMMSKYGYARRHWQIRVASWIERASMRFSNHVITINHPIQALLETRGLARGKATIVMNAVDDSLFAAAATGPAREPGDRGKFIMMYHGTLTHIYGLDIAIEAFAMAQKEMTDSEFWILGGGPEKADLQELAQKLGIQSKVRFIGTVRPEEIPQWLNRCDIGVLATRRDVFLDYSFSNKLSEYIIMRKPVISSNLKAIHYYFSDDALAYFEPNDASDLARQMIRLRSDKALRARLSSRAADEYAPIDWQIMKARYLDLMANLVSGRSAATQPGKSSVPDPVVR
jgi:glycosyltransferase involved in cell wall biosynthesis